MHIGDLDKGIPDESRGRKSTDLRDNKSYDSGATKMRNDYRPRTMTARQPWQRDCDLKGYETISYSIKRTRSRRIK